MAGPGSFYFAWVTETDTTFLPEYAREDIQVISFSMTQKEGDFALFTLSLKNQQVGLLNPGEFRWVWVSYHRASGVAPLFFGRVVGVPTDINRMKETITFRARPEDYQAVKDALAATLRVAPYWDNVWIDEFNRLNSDIVLQARPYRYHIDRLTHDVTISSNILGEDGTLEFFPSTSDHGTAVHLANSLQISYSNAPKSVCRVRAEVGWTQRAVGQIDLTPLVLLRFAQAGSTYPFMITSYTWESLIDNWPMPGDVIGGGWTWIDANAEDAHGRWISEFQRQEDQITSYIKNYSGPYEPNLGFATPDFGFGLTESVQANYTLGVMKPTLIAGFEAERSRVEIVEFTVTSDIQAVLTDPGDDEPIQIDLSSNDVGEPIEVDDSGSTILPLDDPRRASYMTTDRGVQSFEYLLARARASLLDSARCVQLTITVPFENIFDITLRKSAIIYDDRLPGGEASGKIIAYGASGDGNTGSFRTTLTIACCVGQGGAVGASPGTQDYIEDAYIEAGHFTRVGQVHLLDSGDVTYDDYRTDEITDDGIDFFNPEVVDMVQEVVVTNGPNIQQAALDAHFEDLAQATSALEEHTTQICIDFKRVDNGPFETRFDIDVDPLVIPKQIDLEAVGI